MEAESVDLEDGEVVDDEVNLYIIQLTSFYNLDV